MAASAISLCSALGGDVDHVDIGVSDKIAPVAGMMRKVEVACRCGGKFISRIGKRVHLKPVWQVKHLLRGGKAENMRLAHEARPDQADAKDGFVSHAEPPD